MKKKFPYQIVNIHTNSRKPGFIYATIVDDRNKLCVNATLDYCINWIRDKHERLQTNNDDPDGEHPGFGPEADPSRDYEGENTFGPD